jgi:hypothetical protein
VTLLENGRVNGTPPSVADIVVGAGVEASFTQFVGGTLFLETLTVDVSDSAPEIILRNPLVLEFLDLDFNGVILRDAGGALPDFRGLTRTSGTLSPEVRVEADAIFFDLSGDTAGPGAFATYEVDLAPIPLPAGLPLLLAGLGGLALLRRKG